MNDTQTKLYAPLPEPYDSHPGPQGLHSVHLFTAEQVRANEDSTHKLRVQAAQGAVPADMARMLSDGANRALDAGTASAMRDALRHIADCLIAPRAQPVQEERQRLRENQAAAVMPLIGPLLDAWECSSSSVRAEHPELDKQLRRINRAMEEAPDQPVQEAQRGAVPEMESVLIDGTAYPTPMPVACELLRLHMELQERAATQPPAEAVAPGSVPAFSTETLDRMAKAVGMQSALFSGAASCVWSEGCEGVSQEHLQRFAQLAAAQPGERNASVPK